MPRSKVLLTALVTTLAVLAFPASSPAARLSATEEQFRIVFSELLFRASGEEIRCDVTLEGRFENAGVSNKVAGSTYATVTRLDTNFFCRIRFLTENLPWTITYRSFGGTLPNITFVDTTIHPFRLRWGSLSTCLYESEAATQQAFRFARETRTRNFTVGVFTGISLPSADCPLSRMLVIGNGNFFTRNGTGLVTLNLI